MDKINKINSMKTLKDIFKYQWRRDVYDKSPSNRYHHSQIQEIVNSHDFDLFLNCGPGHPGSEAWSIKDLKPKCEIMGFEPQHERYNHLLETKYPGKLYKQAVGEKKDTLEGFMGFKGGKPDFWMHGSEKLVTEGHYKKEIVEVTTIDDILSSLNFNKVFIWADIEGSELTMLKGATQSLEQGKIVGCNLELRAHRVDEGHCTAYEVQDFLSQYNLTTSTPISTQGHKDYVFTKK